MIQQFHSKHISGENQNLKICMFIAALFTIARTWKQSKCPSNEEWIKNMQCMYIMAYYSAIESNKIMPFAKTWMELDIIFKVK